MSHDFRTDTTHNAYQGARAAGHLEDVCRLCEAETITEFSHWRIIANNFPYDAIAAVHHMLIPTRHTKEAALTPDERAELLQLKEQNLDAYDFLLESNRHKRSIPAHYHIHLLVPKEDIQ
jgi:diadenosine tetraphosphate (Ap4A) HIT family hydrolase